MPPIDGGIDLSIIRDALQGAAGYEAITVSDAAIGITSALLNASPAPNGAMLTIEDAPIRFTVNGTTPTDAIGHLRYADDIITIVGRNNLSRLRMIRSGSTDASVKVTLFA